MSSSSKKSDKRTERIPKHKLLRDVYRHYYEFKDYVSLTGQHVIDHVYPVYDDDGMLVEKVEIAISFYDLQEGLLPQEQGGVLSTRKLQAVQLNVIRDLRQRDVAEMMGITTVSVGQYVDQAMLQIARKYFPEDYEDEEE